MRKVTECPELAKHMTAVIRKVRLGVICKPT